jgi:hypothetical protein
VKFVAQTCAPVPSARADVNVIHSLKLTVKLEGPYRRRACRGIDGYQMRASDCWVSDTQEHRLRILALLAG